MNVIEAVEEAFKGKRIRRKEWFFIDKERCVYVYGYRGFDGKITYLLEHREGSKEETPASFSGTDILANDWEVLEE
jgi:hypothetical protein